MKPWRVLRLQIFVNTITILYQILRFFLGICLQFTLKTGFPSNKNDNCCDYWWPNHSDHNRHSYSVCFFLILNIRANFFVNNRILLTLHFSLLITYLIWILILLIWLIVIIFILIFICWNIIDITLFVCFFFSIVFNNLLVNLVTICFILYCGVFNVLIVVLFIVILLFIIGLWLLFWFYYCSFNFFKSSLLYRYKPCLFG